MPKINVLPKHMADLIAAGEVVERPASVIKELMENSIDAGATSLTVEIKRGGITYMRVTDDGCGIEREDIRNAFKSHATSKLKNEEDLLSIGTLGFRGEALASIAAVSKVDILTKTESDEIGTLYKIEGSEEILLDDAGCPQGTTIIVKDIFFNTPARMKFLKKDVTEGNAVAGVVDRIALSHPEVSIRFIRDDKQQLVTNGNGKLQSVVYSVFGKDFSNGLIETEYELDGVKVFGLISLPAAARANRAMQFFFLNGRLVKSVTACAALEQAYKNAIMVGKFPACVLNIEVPLNSVDVNVHPAKTEVRFENEKKIFDAVYYSVKQALEEKDKPTHLDLSKMNLQKEQQNPFTKQASEKWEQVELPKKKENFWATELPKSEPPKPFQRQQEQKQEQQKQENQEQQKQEQQKQEQQEKQERQQEQQIIQPRPEQNLEISDFKVIGEAFDTYILVEQEGKILLIDKHAAHERMLFEKLKAEAESVKSQVLLSPITVTLSKEEYSAVLQNEELLKQSGFDISDFGSGTVVVREVPVMLMNDDINALVEEMAGYLLNSQAPVPEKLDWIYHNTACRAAIKGGDKTTQYELESFVNKLLSNPDIRYCPHGRPVLVEMTRSDLEKQFGRIV
ncbi:MAG: DNA mismatch repair endonuclease MutL [Oscillospiraceae bacterium]|nr:DNA mismatch repair endonuclease MutL [Candidatus Limimonas coprohippi]